jgi:4-diphosphocytidyl-2-C-methyl-D-erythritol kinase
LVTITANGKINLTLDILGKRPDGYHEVEMIMQAINLSDIVTLEKIAICDIILDCAIDGIENKKDNLIYKAAKLFLQTYKITTGVKISLQKNIPIAAGLAGGSADAAATLHGLNRLFMLNRPDEELCELGTRLGSDIPFCIMGGTMLAKGRGEKIIPVQSLPECALVILKPQMGISTAWVYNNYHAAAVVHHPNTRAMLHELTKKNLNGICKLLENVLESVTIKRYPQLAVYKEKLCSYGAKAALMSGSGPSIFAICENYQSAQQIVSQMRADYSDIDVYAAKPANTTR